jgi:hypothetical protein
LPMRFRTLLHLAQVALQVYSIQEKDLLTNVLKQLEPIRSVGCRAREFLPVPW